MSLALFKQKLPRDAAGKIRTPPKQNKKHKSRAAEPACGACACACATRSAPDANDHCHGCAGAVCGAACTDRGSHAASDAAASDAAAHVKITCVHIRMDMKINSEITCVYMLRVWR